MLYRQSPYLYLAVTVALVFAATAVDHQGLRVLLGVLGVAAAALTVMVFLRRAADPNGPPGQH